MNVTERIRRLAGILREENLDEVEVRTWWSSVRISRRRGGVPQQSAQEECGQAAMPASIVPGGRAPHSPSEPASATIANKAYDQIVSPMVGTFYRAPSPEADPFVSEGSRVEVGQVLCIIEAMKLMNEIEAERSGVIRNVLVNDAQPVEFGQPLFLIE